jgi:pimeloyl-ACP methyl ester carboxylesterase
LTIPLITHHGTPGAGLPYEPFVRDAEARGLEYVAYSRPGYADAPRHEGRSVADCAADVAALLDELGAERCYTLGWSGGGPHALACAALLGDRVIKAASVAGVAPFDADGLAWKAGMGEENLQEFAAMEAGPEQLRAFLEQARSSLTAITAEQIEVSLGDLIGDADRRVIAGDFAAWLAETFRTALANSSDGWFDDDIAFFGDWGFDLGAIGVPVTVWQGGDDRMVPFAHGEWVAAHVPGARAELRRGEGHISLLVDRFGEILDDLIAA